MTPWTERQKRLVAAALHLRENLAIASLDGKLVAMCNAKTVDAIIAFDAACVEAEEPPKTPPGSVS